MPSSRAHIGCGRWTCAPTLQPMRPGSKQITCFSHLRDKKHNSREDGGCVNHGRHPLALPHRHGNPNPTGARHQQPNSTDPSYLHLGPFPRGRPLQTPAPNPNPHPTFRRGYRTATIRALDPDHLLRHEPPPHANTYPPEENDTDDSDDPPLTSFATGKTARLLPTNYASTLSSFRGGTAANAFFRCGTRRPATPSLLAPSS